MYDLHKNTDFDFALGGALGGSWDAGLGLEILPNTIASTPVTLSPVGFISPPFVTVFGWDLGPSPNRHAVQQPDVSHAILSCLTLCWFYIFCVKQFTKG